MKHLNVSQEIETAINDGSLKLEQPREVHFVCCIKNNRRTFGLDVKYMDGTHSMFYFSRHAGENVLCAAQRTLDRINSNMGWNLKFSSVIWPKRGTN